MGATFCEWIPEENDKRTLDQLREAVRADPENPYLGHRLALAINREIFPSEPASIADALLDEMRALRQRFPEHEGIARNHLMALSNSASVALSDEIMERNERLLVEVRDVLSTAVGQKSYCEDIDLTILGYQYLGLLEQRRHNEAEDLLASLDTRVGSGSHSERLSWFFAVRGGFWILRGQRQVERMERQIEIVRQFRRRYPDDDYEAPACLLAMLLGSFEFAEKEENLPSADRWFDEACNLAVVASDSYGHAERLYRLLVKGELGRTTRAASLAARLDACWPRYGLRRRIGPAKFVYE